MEGTWGGGGSKRTNNPESIIKSLLGLLARKTRYNYHLARQGSGFSILLVVPKPFISVWLSLTYNSMHDVSEQKFLSGQFFTSSFFLIPLFTILRALELYFQGMIQISCLLTNNINFSIGCSTGCTGTLVVHRCNSSPCVCHRIQVFTTVE